VKACQIALNELAVAYNIIEQADWQETHLAKRWERGRNFHTGIAQGKFTSRCSSR
jgi:hypothetical protein